MTTLAIFNLTPGERLIIASILQKAEGFFLRSSKPRASLTLEMLTKLLNSEEKIFLDNFLNIDPKIHGFKGPYFGITPVPIDLKTVKDQKYWNGDHLETIPTQLVPSKILSAYNKMCQIMEKKISKRVLIESGYRSPAYQLIIFLQIFKDNDWDLPQTMKQVAFPGYSEHGIPSQQALDFITVDGIPQGENPRQFAETSEYEWLMKNANGFNFYLSYPPDNSWGVAFEPWHWSYRPVDKIKARS